MKQNYYLFNPGRMSRKDNTLMFVAVDEMGREAPAKYLPIEGIDNLYIFGSIDTNSALYNYLGQKGISVHFFDYYEHYTGSFQPREYLLAGKSQVAQTQTYLDKTRRLYVAQQFIEGGSFNMLQNLKYYQRRGKAVENQVMSIEAFREQISLSVDVPGLMGLEGNIRQVYYEAFDAIVTEFKMNGRSKQPPDNEVNAVMSFANMLAYTAALDQIYHTQLNPTISFLHEPGARRYSLALDLAEIFKPVLVDRCLFSMFNKGILREQHFDYQVSSCYLKESGRKLVLKEWDARLKETLKHPTLGRSVSYKHLMRLECYKLMKYILKIEAHYRPYHLGNY